MRIDAIGVEAGGGDRLLALVRLTADALPPSAPRPPAHLALALDISSSMGGPPLAAALEAIRRVVTDLGPEDRLGVVVFDREATVFFRPRSMEPEAVLDLLSRLESIKPGLGTNLAAGYSAAADLLATAFVPGARPRVILLTDGFPSAGFTDGDRFRVMAHDLLARGIATSTIGFGSGYDEELLRSMASMGDGAYHFVAGPADLAEVMEAELQAAHAVEAQGTSVKVHPAAGVHSVELLHRYPTRAEHDGLVVEVGTVGRTGPRRILFELRAHGPPSELARLRVAWSPVDGGALGGAVIPVSLEKNPDEGLLRELRGEELLLNLTRSESRLWERLTRGDRSAAAAHLEDARTHLTLLEREDLCPPADTRIHRSRLDDAAAVIAGRLEEEAARRRASSMIDAATHSRLRRE